MKSLSLIESYITDDYRIQTVRYSVAIIKTFRNLEQLSIVYTKKSSTNKVLFLSKATSFTSFKPKRFKVLLYFLLDSMDVAFEGILGSLTATFYLHVVFDGLHSFHSLIFQSEYYKKYLWNE